MRFTGSTDLIGDPSAGAGDRDNGRAELSAVPENGAAVAWGDARAPGVADPEQLRLLHLCTRYAKGGSEQRLRDVCQAFPGAEHTVVLGRGSDPRLLWQHLPSVEVIVEPHLCREPSPLHDALAVAHIRRLMRERAFDLVITHQSKAGVIGRISARLSDDPPVVHSLSMASFGPGYRHVENGVYRPVERFLSRWTDAYAVVGRDLADRFARLGVDASKLNVIRSGVRLPDPHRLVPAVRAALSAVYDLPNDRPWILYVGALEDRKNVMSLPILLQNVALAMPSEEPFLVVAGDGARRDDLQALIDRMGLADDARLLGYVPEPYDLLTAADVLVLLSRAEGLPQVLLQATAVGTPFVCCEVDGVDELLDLGACGSVVDQGDVIAAGREVARRIEGCRGETRLVPSPPGTPLDSWEHGTVVDDYTHLVSDVIARRRADNGNGNGHSKGNGHRHRNGHRPVPRGPALPAHEPAPAPSPSLTPAL